MVIRERTIGICQFCGEEFTRKRISGKFCKPAHRTAYNRLPSRIDNMMQTALGAIYAICELHKEHSHLSAENALKRIEDYAQWQRSHLTKDAELQVQKQQIDVS